MKVVTIQQNTQLWHAWRGKGLGASDAPAVMGVSPYQTPFALWGDKTGLIPRAEPNAFAVAAMQRGQQLEPEARDLYKKLMGRKVEPLAAEHDDHAFVRASFDGIETDTLHFVEIKCPGQAAHDIAKEGRVPDYYYPQIQQQFLVSGGQTADYFSYRPGDAVPHVIVPVKPDPSYQKELLERLIQFWGYVETQTPPPVARKEFLSVLQRVCKEMDKVRALLNALVLMEEATMLDAPARPKRQLKAVKQRPPDKDGFFKVT